MLKTIFWIFCIVLFGWWEHGHLSKSNVTIPHTTDTNRVLENANSISLTVTRILGQPMPKRYRHFTRPIVLIAVTRHCGVAKHIRFSISHNDVIILRNMLRVSHRNALKSIPCSNVSDDLRRQYHKTASIVALEITFISHYHKMTSGCWETYFASNPPHQRKKNRALCFVIMFTDLNWF